MRGLSHITGGGLTDNLPRTLPADTAARIDRAAWTVPALFQFLQRHGNVDEAEMFRTFNMGIGMVVIVSPEDVEALESHLTQAGEEHRRVGEVVSGSGGVRYA